MKVFIIHYKKLTERKEYLTKVLNDLNLDFQFIEEFDRDDYNMGNISYDENLWKDRIHEFKLEHYPTFDRLRDSEICNSLSHIKACEEIVKQGLDYGIVLEDDIILEWDFVEQVKIILESVPKDYDYIFLGNSYSMLSLDKIHNCKSINVSGRLYKKEPGTTRTVDSYIVSNKASKEIIKELSTIALPFDHEMNYFFKKLNMNVYWYEPGITRQGSRGNEYHSSIR